MEKQKERKRWRLDFRDNCPVCKRHSLYVCIKHGKFREDSTYRGICRNPKCDYRNAGELGDVLKGMVPFRGGMIYYDDFKKELLKGEGGK